jgi:hypothetical protein
MYVVNPLYTGSSSFLFKEGSGLKDLIKKRNAYDKTIAELPKVIEQAEGGKKIL